MEAVTESWAEKALRTALAWREAEDDKVNAEALREFEDCLKKVMAAAGRGDLTTHVGEFNFKDSGYSWQVLIAMLRDEGFDANPTGSRDTIRITWAPNGEEVTYYHTSIPTKEKRQSYLRLKDHSETS